MECWVYVDGGDTEAFVVAANDLAVKDPTALARDEAIGRSRTPSVKKPGERQRVQFDFVALGPGKAYFDDLRIRKVPTQ